MFHIGYLITFGGFIITFTDLVAARFCEGGHRCLPPKECCAQGCCYLYAPPSAPRSPPPATDHVLNLFFINHWYFWCVVLAIILALLCACSIWKKRRQLCGWGSPGLHSQSEGDSAGSCYAPPQYSRCSSFHHAPPPYTEVTSKPDLYPLVFTCNGDSGKGGANYLMVQYFRNYIVRPAGGSLSATSTVDSLSSSFICTANEANTLVPPPYSRAASPDLPVTLQGYTIPRSASQQACTLDNTNFNRSNSVPPPGQINGIGNIITSGASGGVGSMIITNGVTQQHQTHHHNQQQQQQNIYPNQPGMRTPTNSTSNQPTSNVTNYQMRLSESANFHNLLRSSNSLANNININNSKNNNNNNNFNNNNNNNNTNLSNNNRNSRNINPVQMSQSEGQFRYNENLSNSNSINGLQYYSSNGGSLNSASGELTTANLNKNINNCYKNTQQQQQHPHNHQQHQSSAHNDSTSSSQQYINHQQQYQPQYHHHQGSNVYNSCSSIGGISITVPNAQDTERDYQELNTLRNNLDSCSQILQQQQKINGTDGSFISEESPVIEIMKRFDIIRSYTTSNTGSAVSSLANMSSPSSPPRATSPTNEVRDLLDQIRKLQNGTSCSLDSQAGGSSSIDGACKMSTSLTSGNSVTTTAVPISKRPSTLQSQKKKFFSTKCNKSSYTPIASNSNTKSSRSPVGCNSILGRGRGRRGWISRSAPTTPGTALPPNHLGDDSPLLTEHDEENV